jgi:hypothetical protein
MCKFSAFLFGALIFFVTFLHQGKKVNRDYPFAQKPLELNKYL